MPRRWACIQQLPHPDEKAVTGDDQHGGQRKDDSRQQQESQTLLLLARNDLPFVLLHDAYLVGGYWRGDAAAEAITTVWLVPDRDTHHSCQCGSARDRKAENRDNHLPVQAERFKADRKSRIGTPIISDQDIHVLDLDQDFDWLPSCCLKSTFLNL